MQRSRKSRGVSRPSRNAATARANETEGGVDHVFMAEDSTRLLRGSCAAPRRARSASMRLAALGSMRNRRRNEPAHAPARIVEERAHLRGPRRLARLQSFGAFESVRIGE